MLDWPVGPLGTGYLASVHAVQFLGLAMIAPPLLLLGLAPRTVDGLVRRPVLGRVLAGITHPLVAMVGFTVVMVVTHAPRVVDTLMATQLGAFALDAAWLGSGLAFWWPIIGASPARPRFVPPLQMGYLFLGTLAHLFIAMWLLLAKFPVYRTYELAPPISPSLTALADQQLAGGVLLLLGGPYVLAAISVIFFRWQGTGEERQAESGVR
jgi:putative membrane protein